MTGIAKGLIVLAALGFLLAVFGTLSHSNLMGVTAEGFSRGSSNLALLALAISMTFRE